jgi:Flp pilus assembly protein TadB
MLKLDADACPECGSKAISIQKNTGFKNLYKCEKCNCLMQLVLPKTIPERVGAYMAASIVFLLIVAYLYSELVFSALYVFLSFLICITSIIFGVRSLYAKRSFKKIVRP